MIRPALEFGLLALAASGLISCSPEPRPRPIGSQRPLGPDTPDDIRGETIPPTPPLPEQGAGTRVTPVAPGTRTAPVPGGEGFSIDPGFWILSASGVRSNERGGKRGEPRSLIRDLRVELSLRRQDGREIVEIRFASDDAQRASKAQTLIGAIRSDPLDPERRILTAQGRDAKFQFRIDGTVNSRSEVRGTIVGKEIAYAPESEAGQSKIYGFFSLDRIER